jgi:hypothetical protein
MQLKLSSIPWITIPHRMSLWCPSTCYNASGCLTLYLWRRMTFFSLKVWPNLSTHLSDHITQWCWILSPWWCKNPIKYHMPDSGFWALNVLTSMSRSPLLRFAYAQKTLCCFMYRDRVFQWTFIASASSDGGFPLLPSRNLNSKPSMVIQVAQYVGLLELQGFGQ